jgi:peptidoglycan/xylan/chitin deacetylase (PgdA/CDA1 family)
MYHSVSPAACDYNAVSTKAFAEQMNWLANERHPLTLEEVRTVLQGGQVSEGSVLITFDDGYQDLVDHAIPVLQKHSIPAIFFLLIEAMGSNDLWNTRAHVTRRHLAPEDVRALAALPKMTIGAHGFTHQRITRFEEYRVVAEMAGAKAGLQALTDQNIDAYAYPYGGFTPEVAAVAARYFSFAFASDGAGVWNWLDNPYTIRRLHVGYQLSLSGFIRLLEKGMYPDRPAIKAVHN